MRIVAALVVLGMVAVAPVVRAAPFSDLQGHLAVGYAKLFSGDAPGGSLSVGAGLDLPIVRGLRAGIDIGYHLLGTRTVERGSFFASVDYSVFEVDALAHWQPPSAGPLARVSLGPGLVAAHADLSTASGGGAAFSDLAVSETAPAIVGQLSFMTRRATPVRMGVEVGVRTAFLERDNWTVGDLRVVAHY